MNKEPWFTPASLIKSPFKKDYLVESRKFQGIPSIETSKNGRIFATWQIGGDKEPHEDNCIVLSVSDDQGETFSDPYMVIDHDVKKVRLCNPVIWKDNLNRIWLFWSQSDDKETYKMGVWAIYTENPDEKIDLIKWSEPKRYTDYIIINKPIVTKDKRWLFGAQNFKDRRYTNIYASNNDGSSFKKIGRVKSENPNCKFSETMLIEKDDGKICIFSRLEHGADGGMEYSESTNGRKWKIFKSDLPYPFRGPGTRFYIRRLKSGNVIFVNNDSPTLRTNLKAYLYKNSEEKFYEIVLDDREYLSYPDGCEDDNGNIYVIYDRNRSFEREILMCVFNEEDIIKGIRPKIKLISKGLGGEND